MQRESIVPSLVGFGMGIPFGMAFYHSNVFRPAVVTQQLQMENWDMFRTFMSAVSVGGSCVSLLYATSNIKLISRPFHPITTPLGGLILGSGMYLTGACPGTIWAQIGVGVTGLFIY